MVTTCSELLESLQLKKRTGEQDAASCKNGEDHPTDLLINFWALLQGKLSLERRC